MSTTTSPLPLNSAEAFRRSRILIIDDEPQAVELLAQILTEEGYCEIESVTDPREALTRFVEFQPDVVLLDWKMPHLSGGAVLRQMRRHAAGTYIPIIVVTVLSQSEIKTEALLNGATDFIVKPYDAAEIVLRVAIHLRTRLLYRTVEEQNVLLQRRVEQRTAELTAANASLQEARSELEERVRRRTDALVQANTALANQSVASKEAQAAAHLRALILDCVGEAVIATDVSGRITYVNRTAEQLYGWNAEEMITRDIFDLTVPYERRAEVDEMMRQVLAGKSWQGETSRCHRDGRNFPVMAVISPLFDAMGQLTGQVTITRDISERKKTEAALRESERRLRAIFETSPVMMFIKDLEGRCTMMNRGLVEIGISADQMLNRLPSEYLPADAAARTEAGDRAVISSGRAQTFEQWIDLPQGRRTYFTAKAPLYDDEGRIYGICGVSADLTELKRAEEAVRQTEKRLNFLLRNTPAVIHTIALAPGLPVTFVSDNVRAYLGYGPEEILNRPQFIFEHLHPEDRRYLRLQMQLLLKHGRIAREFRLRHRDGHYVWVNNQAILVRNAAGEPQEIIGYGIEITRRKHIEAALRESEERLRALVQSLDEIVFEFDGEGKYLNVWTENEDLLVKPKSELLGRRITDVLGQEAAAPFVRLFQSVMKNCCAETMVYELDVANGRQWFLARVSPIRSSEGKCRAVCMLSREITQQKRIEHELRQTKEEAERANAAKSEFLSRMSHELRTPLNAIIGFAQLAEADAKSDEERENIVQILHAGQHLLQLINEILDISRIEAGREEMQIQPVALQVAASAALALVQPLATGRGVELPPFSCNYYILADEQRLQQVLLNFLSNAIKYNQAGGKVELRCRELPNNMLRLEVVDTGIGIERYDLPRLFQPFQRVGAAAGEVEGVGLGLAISDRLIRSMGGSTGVESAPGVGSTFWFELPLANTMPDSEEQPRQPAALDAEPPEYPVDKTLLYIEDNLPNLRLVERILMQRPALKMITAQQGSIGLELARHHLPDVVLLDVHLPDMQGDEVLTWLRTDRRTRHIPVLVISADAIGSEIERLKELGAVAYITKPFDVRHFLGVLDQVLAGAVPASG